MSGLIGKKIGMSRIFNSNGEHIPVTIIQAGPCFVTQVKSDNKDGYRAMQIGFEEIQDRKVTKPLKGHFKKAGVMPKRFLAEFLLGEKEDYKVGDEINVTRIKVGQMVEVIGVSKGRGFTGVVKRHGFSGGPKTHGQSDRLRAPGSIGASSYPSRVWPGMRMAGRDGNKTIHLKELMVVKIDEKNNLLFIKGAVPGARNGLVRILSN